MIKIRIPNNNVSERRYIVDVVFSEFLGLDYEIVVGQEQNYVVELSNTSLLVFQDHFFSNFIENKSYLKKESLPKSIHFVTNKFCFDKDIPVIYGNDFIKINKNYIEVGIDIFASSFFCLTRWEEYVLCDQRDIHDRFPANKALLFQYNCSHRPVVNEYVEMVWAMLNYLDPSLERKINKFEIIFSHDIDVLKKPVSLKHFAKDIIIRRSFKKIFLRLGYLFTSKNPYDMIEYFMDVSEKNNSKSRFYFMTGHHKKGMDGEDYLKTKIFNKAIKQIMARKHTIGIHPSYTSCENSERILNEKSILENLCQINITEGRQHVLKFNIPMTWQYWSDNGLLLDSTLGYSAMPGFRCGTGNSFKVFNFLTRKVLSLQELPLIVMDTTLQVNQKLSISESEKRILYFIDIGRKYNMPITLLFHNCFWDEIEWKGWSILYKNIFETF